MASNTATTGPIESQKYKEMIRLAARDETLVGDAVRAGALTAGTVAAAEQELNVLGHIVARSCRKAFPPFGHGSDETVAVGTIPVDALKALDEFFTKHDIQLPPMPDPTTSTSLTLASVA